MPEGQRANIKTRASFNKNLLAANPHFDMCNCSRLTQPTECSAQSTVQQMFQTSLGFKNIADFANAHTDASDVGKMLDEASAKIWTPSMVCFLHQQPASEKLRTSKIHILARRMVHAFPKCRTQAGPSQNARIAGRRWADHLPPSSY